MLRKNAHAVELEKQLDLDKIRMRVFSISLGVQYVGNGLTNHGLYWCTIINWINSRVISHNYSHGSFYHIHKESAKEWAKARTKDHLDYF